MVGLSRDMSLRICFGIIRFITIHNASVDYTTVKIDAVVCYTLSCLEVAYTIRY